MKTETLNEYIFADLVYKHAQIHCNHRRKKMFDEGVSDDILNKLTLTYEDEVQAVNTLNEYRALSVKLLQE